MGLFKKQPPKEDAWVDEIESYVNFAGDLKYATDQIIEASVSGNDWLVEQIWENMTTEQRQYGFWFLLGMVTAVIQREAYEQD